MSAASVPTLDRASPREPDRLRAIAAWFLQPEITIRIVLYLATALYLRTVLFDYVYDDSLLLILNPGMESWRAIPSFFTHTFWGFLEIPRVIDFYRPLVMTVLAAIYHVLGPAPGWFHLITAGIHILASYLVYRLVCETTEDKFIAAIAAGIFSLHPTKVETAAWISGLSDSLSAVFFLASMIAYFRWRKTGATNPRLVAESAIFLLLALFSKEAAVFASVLIAVYEFSSAKPGLRNRCLEMVRSVWPFVAVTLLAIATRVILVRNPAGRSVNDVSFLPTLLTAPQAILWYLGKQLWPVGLSIHYPIRSVTQFSFTAVVLPLLLLLTLGVVVVGAVGRRPIGIFFLSWFGIMLAPTILFHNILQEHDRYFYFASVATSIGLAYVVAQTRRVGIVPQAMVVLTLFGLMAAATFNYESYWDNDIKLFTRAIQIAPNNPNVVDYLASVYINQHNFEKAASVAQALINNPELSAQGWYTLGNVRFTEGNYPEARAAMQKAVQLSHGHNLLSNVGLATLDLKLGNNQEAAEIYQNALKTYPEVAYLHGGLATALSGLGRTDEAHRERELQKRLNQN